MSLVLKEVKDGVAVIKMNDPKTMNGLGKDMVIALLDAIKEANEDDSVKVVLLGGEGKGFCGGGNLAIMYEKIKSGTLTTEGIDVDLERIASLARYIRVMPKPVICVVHGAAAGAGASVVFAADFTVSSPEAKYVEAFINVGLVPDTLGMFWIAKAVGYKRATELTMLGDVFSAEEALRLGLINKVVPKEELWDEAFKLANKLKKKPVDSVRFIKAMVNVRWRGPVRRKFREGFCDR